MILRGAIISKGLDLSLAIISGSLGLFRLKIPDYETYDGKIDEEEYEDLVSSEGTIPLENKRETLRILKKELLDQKNPVEYQEFALLESRSVRREIWLKVRAKERRIVDISNYVLLFLNRISSNHGVSYGRGILFTGIVGLLFFYLSFVCTNEAAFAFDFSGELFSIGFKHYWQFLVPTHSVNYLVDLHPSRWFYFWDFVGRIFVAYGIYQTVQAFRKYR